MFVNSFPKNLYTLFNPSFGVFLLFHSFLLFLDLIIYIDIWLCFVVGFCFLVYFHLVLNFVVTPLCVDSLYVEGGKGWVEVKFEFGYSDF